MIRALVWHGNAVTPYAVMAAGEFHTDFAARLFGFLSCQGRPYTHWSVEEVPA